MRRLAILGAVGLASACSPSLDLPDGGFTLLPDRMMELPPGPPTVDPRPPPVTPYNIITFRGFADGRRVFIESNGLNPQAVLVGSGGTFCADIRVTNPGSYLFDLRAFSSDGQLGDGLEQRISVTYDPSAPDIQGLLTCQGVSPKECEGQIEICDNMRDDDCNNLVDQADPACNPCIDDELEDNDDASAARIAPGNYAGLQLCPDDPDFYGVFLREGEVLDAQIDFTHTEGDLTLDLYGFDRGNGERPLLDRSDSIDNGESLTFTATASGQHVLGVYGSSDTQNVYDLTISIR